MHCLSAIRRFCVSSRSVFIELHSLHVYDFTGTVLGRGVKYLNNFIINFWINNLFVWGMALGRGLLYIDL